MAQKRILLTGIPGTGKTTIGQRLEGSFDFIHYDFEDNQIYAQFHLNPQTFFKDEKKDIVISWGFVPNEDQISLVKNLKTTGFKLIWFDGNREAARREFNKRGTVSEDLLNLQLSRINNADVISVIGPYIINTFDENGSFRSIGDIISEIFTID